MEGAGRLGSDARALAEDAFPAPPNHADTGEGESAADVLEALGGGVRALRLAT